MAPSESEMKLKLRRGKTEMHRHNLLLSTAQMLVGAKRGDSRLPYTEYEEHIDTLDSREDIKQ